MPFFEFGRRIYTLWICHDLDASHITFAQVTNFAARTLGWMLR